MKDLQFTTKRTVRAKLFAIIAQQGKTSAATALFKSRHQVEALESVSWKDIEWYVTHPSRSSISGMYGQLGFPKRNLVEGLERWVKSEAPAGHEKKLLSSITAMQHGRGVPSNEDLNGLKSWCVENSSHDSWTALLSSITGMQCGRGAPTKEDLNGLKSWCLSHAGTDRWRLLLSHVAA